MHAHAHIHKSQLNIVALIHLVNNDLRSDDIRLYSDMNCDIIFATDISRSK